VAHAGTGEAPNLALLVPRHSRQRASVRRPHPHPSLIRLVAAQVLGHRDFARLYRQKPRPEDDRRSVLVNTMLARCGVGLARRPARNPRTAHEPAPSDPVQSWRCPLHPLVCLRC
jgi:hypothetical protein